MDNVVLKIYGIKSAQIVLCGSGVGNSSEIISATLTLALLALIDGWPLLRIRRDVIAHCQDGDENIERVSQFEIKLADGVIAINRN